MLCPSREAHRRDGAVSCATSTSLFCQNVLCMLGATSPACAGVCVATPGTFCGIGAAASSGLPCPIGQYSPDSQGTCLLCPLGLFGNTTGLTSTACSDSCSATAGLVCTAGATSATGVPCPMGQYGSTGSLGNCTMCPAGRYGGATGLTTSSCSGLCSATSGSYCGVGATTSIGTPCTHCSLSTGWNEVLIISTAGASVLVCSPCLETDGRHVVCTIRSIWHVCFGRGVPAMPW